jgi:hypothetical protein
MAPVSRRGTSRRTAKQLLLPRRNPRLDPNPRLSVSTARGHWKRNCPKYFADKKAGNVNKGIFYIHVIDVYLTNARSSTWVFDTGSVTHICNSK